MADDISDDSEVELIPLEGYTSKYFGFPGKDGQYLERQEEA